MAIFCTPKLIISTVIFSLCVSLIGEGLVFTDQLVYLILGVFLLYKLIARERL